MSEKSVLPEKWNEYRVKDILSAPLRDFGSFSLTNLIEFVDDGIPFIKSESVKQGYIDERKISYITAPVHKLLYKSVVKKGDILYTKIGALGRVAIYDGSLGECNSNAATVKINVDKGRIDPLYFTYLLMSEPTFRELEKHIVSTPPRINLGEIGALPLLYPPLKQQQKIAKILSTVDNLIEKTQTLTDKYTAIKQGMMADLFTRGIDMTTGDTANSKGGKLRPSVEDAPELYKQTELGWVPNEWEVRLLSEVVDQKRPIVYGILMPGTGVIEGVPVIKVRDIKGGVVIEDGLLITSHKIDQQYRRSKVKQGDLLYTIRGTVGRLAKVTETLDGANITQDTARVAIAKGDEDFYMAYLDSHSCRVFSEINTLGVAVQGINLGALRKMPVVSPPLLEQQRIKERSLGIERLISKEKKYVEELKKQKKGLMQDLLTGKVKVQ
jgi:type I restriction enzyme S subunit